MTFEIANLLHFLLIIPLFSSVCCQFISKKELNSAFFFLILFTIFSICIFLSYKIDFDQNFQSEIFSLTLQINKKSLIFLSTIIFLKIIILSFYKPDFEKSLTKKNQRLFFSVNLINIFAISAIFTTNNLINLFVFLEIFTLSIFSIFAISKDKKIDKETANYFILNIIASLILLFLFLMIYLNFSTFDLSEIAKKLILKENIILFKSFSLMFLSAFLIKFLPITFYFKLLKHNNSFSNFIIAHSFFILSNTAIFLISKFDYIFFTKNSICSIIFLLSFFLIVFSSFKLIFSHHLKILTINFALISLGFIFLAKSINNELSHRSEIFYFLNFNLIALFLFTFATFLKRKFNSSKIELISFLSLLESKQLSTLLFLLKAAFLTILILPFSFLFYGNYQIIASTFMQSNLINSQFSTLVQFLIFSAIFISFFAILNFSLKILSQIFNPQDEIEEEFEELENKEFARYFIIFFAIIFISYFLILTPQILNKLYIS